MKLPLRERRPGKKTGNRRMVIAGGVVFTLLMVVFYLWEPVFVRFLDQKAYDTLARSVSGRTAGTGDSPVVVDVDEKTLAAYGQWPWPRYVLAGLLDRIREMRPAGIGVDMVIAEPDRTSFLVLRDDVRRHLKMDVPLAHVPEALMDHDKALGEVLSRGPFVLGYRFTFAAEDGGSSECLLHPVSLVAVGKKGAEEATRFLFQARDVVCSLTVLCKQAVSSGFLNAIPDSDGVLRRIPLMVRYDGNIYPSLTLAVLMKALGTDRLALDADPGGITALHLGDRTIPLDGKGDLLIRYRGNGKTLAYVSAGDILAGRVPAERIKRRVVFVGATAVGLADHHVTPLDPVFPGVEVLATAADNILRKEFFFRPVWAPGAELLLILGAGLLSTVLLTWAGPVPSLIFLCIGASALWGLSFSALYRQGMFLSPVIPLVTLLGNFSFLIFLKYRYEARQAKARTKEIAITQDFTIRCLASLTETRDSETGGHILRTQQYVRTICRQLTGQERFRDLLDDATIDDLYKSAPLHDIGKVGVPDSILRKPGKLTDEEFEEMKRHTTYGRDAILRAEERFGKGASSSFLRLAKEMAYTHHEKWDGTGYPERLRGSDIPLSGRIMALADVYDALVCHRVYKPPIVHEEAVSLIVQLRGILFDPAVVDAFLEVQKEFKEIADSFADTDEHGDLYTHEPGH